jgi:hypothetical protein
MLEKLQKIFIDKTEKNSIKNEEINQNNHIVEE